MQPHAMAIVQQHDEVHSGILRICVDGRHTLDGEAHDELFVRDDLVYVRVQFEVADPVEVLLISQVLLHLRRAVR